MNHGIHTPHTMWVFYISNATQVKSEAKARAQAQKQTKAKESTVKVCLVHLRVFGANYFIAIYGC